MKFLKKSYIQRAIGEEAKGNYQQAAAYYSKAEEFEKVGEMYEAMGDMIRAFPARIRAYQQALRWYKVPQNVENLAQKLAKIMEVEIRADTKVTTIEAQRLQKAAEYYALGKMWGEAGRIYEELGQLDEAIEMYIQAGDVVRIEQLSASKESRSQRSFSARQYYEESEVAARIGRRDKAYDALKQCLRIEKTHAKARAALETLEQSFATNTRRFIRVPLEECEYLLFGKPLVTVGRLEDSDIVLTHHDISRHHARIGFKGPHCIVEDLNSSNGTRINGLRIQKQAEVRDSDLIGIGRSTPIECRLHKRGENVSIVLRPKKSQGGVRKEYLLFSQEAQLGFDRKCDIVLRQKLSGLPGCLFKIRYRQPFWYLHLHPHLTELELNGVAVEDYVTILPGDILRLGGLSFLVE
ncbi:MAG: FHA domain-containing protein [bacterium]|nr:FHA domain-containing protein [bacterium]